MAEPRQYASRDELEAKIGKSVASATTVLSAYAELNGVDPEDVAGSPEVRFDAFTDLLTDLMHYAEELGMEWMPALDRAEVHFTAERAGLEETPDEEDHDGE